MQITSAEYQNAIIDQNNLRQFKAKVIYSQIDNTAKPDCTPSSSEIKSESNITFLIDGTEDVNFNYASFEQDRWKLDGSFALVGDETSLIGINSINDTLSDLSYEILPNWTVTLDFLTNHSSSGITISFDTLNNEYATEFDISYYNSSYVLITTATVIGNTLSNYQDFTSVSNWRQIIITIKKWSHTERLAKISEVYFGLVKEFSSTNNKLIDLSIDEEVDIVSASIGGNTMKFSIDNLNQEYNPLAPNSIYTYAVPRQTIQTLIGIKLPDDTYEYVPAGTYYLKDIQTKPSSLTAEFNAEGLLYFLGLSKYQKGLLQTITMYDLATAVLVDAGLLSDQYDVDIALDSISMECYLDIMTHKDCLQAIAIASNAILYEDRLGRIVLKQLNTTPTTSTITSENIFEEPIIKTNKSIKLVNIAVNTSTIASSFTEVGKATLNITGTVNIQINYNGPSSDVSAAISYGTINSSTYFTNMCLLNVTVSGPTTITLTGKEITNTENIQSYTTGNIDGETYSISNPIITDSTIADSIAAHIIERKSYINETLVKWRQDPSFECGDVLASIQHKFGYGTDVILLTNQMKFSGNLTGTTTFIGKVV